ncbi:hypothetical protein [Polaromonas sp. CG9_12]|nr:hypothetical protein [Polaromonas sp. CG9_12]
MRLGPRKFLFSHFQLRKVTKLPNKTIVCCAKKCNATN